MKRGKVGPGATKSIAWTSTLVLGSLGLALVVAEVLLRALGVSHPVFLRADPLTGVGHIPGAEGWYTAEGRSYVRINTGGWRGKERPLRKPAGVTRIAILGDSYTEALQVPEDSAFPSLLEHDLNSTLPGRYEVLNFGLSGFGTGQELLVLRHQVLEYAPDAVILAFTTGNDVSDNSRALNQVDYVPYFGLVDQRLVLDTSFLTSPGYLSRSGWRAHALAFLAQHSRVVQLVNRARQAAREAASLQRRLTPSGSLPAAQELGLYDGVYLNPPPDSTWAEAWNVTESLLTLINVECRSRNIPFYLVTLSSDAQVTPDTSRQRVLAADLGVPDLFQPERRLERLGIRQGFDVLALAPLLSSQAIATHEHYHGFGDDHRGGHWNERGHRAAATLLSSWLADRLPRDLGHR